MILTIDDIERFWGLVDHLNDEDCWNWKGNICPSGYGRFGFSNTNIRAHRISWELSYGEISENMHVLHHCDNRKCVNPNHLFLGTNDDNIIDKINKGRQSKGIERPAHKLSEEEVIKMRTLHASGKYTYESLAKAFNMAIGQTWMIVNRKAWKHVL